MNELFAPSASLTALEQRDLLLRGLRTFFHSRGFIEVETPLVASEIIPELHIEPLQLGDSPLFLPSSPEIGADLKQEKGTVPLIWFLQASPEFHMKRLLAAGAKAIFQVTRSFRGGERGRLHNPEFAIVEWYRAGDDMRAGIDLVDELAQSLLGTPPAKRTTYAEAFQREANLCPHTATAGELSSAAERLNVAVPEGMNRDDRDQWLNLLLAVRVEPQLGRERPEIVYHYPASQASLAKVVPSNFGYDVAERFELYYRGIELANGFHELADAAEQRRRFEAVNAARGADGRRPLPIPESLLAALEHGLPDCTGCALGFDRLVMLASGARKITDTMAFG